MSPAAGRKQSATETATRTEPQSEVTAGAESDVDELVDSDTEKASEAAAKAVKSTKANKTKANAIKKSSSTLTSPPKKTGSVAKEQEIEIHTAPSSAVNSAEARVEGSSKAANSSNVKDKEKQQALKRDSPNLRESLGRTATGGAVPYYYPQNGAHQGSGSPGRGTNKKAASRDPSFGSMPRGSTAVKEEDTHGGGRDLTPEEVDKFLALIEKYDLDTSNDDDMARSVTEVYQEWLEWCAKRNVKSSKSKQALVSEFPKLYSGYYGTEYRDRAMGIVQRQQSARAALAANKGQDTGYARDRGMYTGADSQAPQSADGRVAPSRSIPGPSSSTLRSSPNGHGMRQAQARAEMDHAHAAAQDIPSAILESMHVQIRDEIWREASMMLNQIVHERFIEMANENHALHSRIEQLEVHSDNLAQWVQHLNRVQEDLQHYPPPMHPSGHIPPTRAHYAPHEDVVVEDGGRGRQAYMPSGPANGPVPSSAVPVGGAATNAGGPSYHPAHGSVPNASPHHRYSGLMRRSMTPPRSHYGVPPPQHGNPYQEAYDRHDLPPPGSHPQSSHHPPPPPPHQQHPAYRTSPRGIPPHPASAGPAERHSAYHDEHPSRGAGGPPPPPGMAMHAGSGHGGMPPPVSNYEGRSANASYGSAPYPSSRDDRQHGRRPDSPPGVPAMDARHAKRPRNGGSY